MNKIKNLDIIVPARNEAKSIPLLVKKIHTSLEKAEIKYRIIIVDDRSEDNTAAVVKKLAKTYPLILHKKQGKLGKAFSILEGAKLAKSEFVCMIDADLQYPPEAIPEMLKLAPEHGVVVANRTVYKSHWFRKFASRLNTFLFGRLLFGFRCDVQSGLKIFRRKILASIDKSKLSPWTLDIPLLYTARGLNLSIGSININFHKRHNGESKISFLKTALEISFKALRLKLFDKGIFEINTEIQEPGADISMLGAGVVYKKQRYITHTKLSHHKSALITFVRWQKLFILSLVGLVAFGLVHDPKITAIAVIAVLSFIYFLDVLFNLYLILKGLYYPPEIKITDKEIKSLDEKKLPVYSILCPLYKEATVLPQFVKAINKLDWPKEKLDVLLLLEKDDEITIRTARELKLPKYFRMVIVPPSNPKTKPKACNYGLAKAKGKYVVIYDAEDKPDPLQLKKAYLGFAKAGKRTVCLQAKLNYYNTHQNLLTKLFTAEYSLWFDVILPGLQSIETNIPLGGTSNHFPLRTLKKLKGWDPFNVTEDCDLGVRLFKDGYKTAIFDSVTLEEANSNLKNWLRQRSRWFKGYLQTYLVHMRNPLQFFRKHGWHTLLFQLTIGLKIIFTLINPILWLATISYFCFYAVVGPTIESLYPTTVFYFAAFSLVAGNFMYLYNYMIGCAKREQWSVIKYVFLIPIYWFFMGLGALIAIKQLIFKPHYWEKTHHGLHFAYKTTGRQDFKSRAKRLAPAGTLVGASIIANFFNFLFNAYLGRHINLEEFGLISVFSNLLLILGSFWGALSQTVTHRSAYLLGQYELAAKAFWRFMRKKAVKIALISTGIWLICLPFLSSFFQTENLFAFILFAPVIMIGLVSTIDTGFLSGNLKFASLAILVVLGPLIKFLTAYGLVKLNYQSLVYAAIPTSMLLTFVPAFIMAKSVKSKKPLPVEEHYFPRSFFGTALLANLGTSAFLSLDIILAKHFLPPLQAGLYALLSLAGKMIYFGGSLFGGFVNPLVSKRLGAGRDTKRVFYRLLSLNALASISGFIVIGLFGRISLPILFGLRVVPIAPLLPIYCLGLSSFTIATAFIAYHQARKEYVFSYVGFLLGLGQIIGISLFHHDLASVAKVVSLNGMASLLMISLLHIFYEQIKTFGSNLLDFLGLFGYFGKAQAKTPEHLKILIFNWRDTKHVWGGGAEVYIHELAKQWLKQGHKVTVFCGNDRKNPRNEVVDGIQIVRRGGFYTVYFWAFLYYILRFRGLFDIIVDCENGIPFFTPLYVRKPVFLVIHHVHQEIFMEHLKAPLSWLAIILERTLMPLVYKNSQVITISPSSKKAIMRYGLSKKEPKVIYCGVNLATYVPGKKAKKPLILYVGRLQAYKNLRVLIKAVKNLAERLVPFRLVIAGFGKERASLEKLVENLKLKTYVEFVGKISEAQKIGLYQKAWVAVNPSSMEGWGITSIEANACGTPVVVANVPGLRDSVKNPSSGFFADYQNPDEFAELIFRIITNRSLRQDLAKTSREWAENFTWEKSAKECLSLFKKRENH